jgi:hypothetical protein
MSGNTFGKLFTVTGFGESHGPALGCIVDGCPPGLELSTEDLQRDLDRRKPGTSRHTTQRREADAAITTTPTAPIATATTTVATAAATAATTAAAATTITTTTATTATATTIFRRPCLIHAQIPTINFRAVQGCNCCVGGRWGHLDKAKTTKASSLPIRDPGDRFYFAKLRKEIANIRFCSRERQITYVNFLSQLNLSPKSLFQSETQPSG